jgi:hypothetical protein
VSAVSAEKETESTGAGDSAHYSKPERAERLDVTAAFWVIARIIPQIRAVHQRSIRTPPNSSIKRNRGGLLAVSIPGRVFASARPTEIATVVLEVICRTNVFWEEKFFVQSNAMRIFLSKPGNLLR